MIAVLPFVNMSGDPSSRNLFLERAFRELINRWFAHNRPAGARASRRSLQGKSEDGRRTLPESFTSAQCARGSVRKDAIGSGYGRS